MNRKYKPFIRRLIVIIAATLVISLAVSELVFISLGEKTDREPMEVELVIPAGTAEKVARGEEEVSIPNEMVFVLGDVLIVINEDNKSHELGPIFVLPGSSASMVLDEANQFAMSCSFRPSKYFGLTIKEPTTIQTRIEGVFFMVPSTVAIVFLYSLVIRPIKLDDVELEVGDSDVALDQDKSE